MLLLASLFVSINATVKNVQASHTNPKFAPDESLECSMLDTVLGAEHLFTLNLAVSAHWSCVFFMNE